MKSVLVAVLLALAIPAAKAATTAYSNAVLALDPLAFYQFEEFNPFGQIFVYEDSSGNDNHITALSGTSAGHMGFNGGGAISFNGTSDSLATPLTFDPSTTAWTVELVLSTDAILASTQVIVSNRDGTGLGRSNITVNALGVADYNTFIGGGTNPSGGTVAPDIFEHVVMTYDGASLLSYYVNGQLAGSANNKIPESANGAWILGAHKSQNSQRWGGDMDEAVFYTTALSAADIATNYAALTIPEPSTGSLVFLAAIGLARRRRR